MAGRVRLASSLAARTRGLLGRPGLEPGQGLWLAPCKQVHTFFMSFSIDVVFLDAGQRVVGLCRDLAPWRLSPLFWRAASALELAAHGAAHLNPDDALLWRKLEDQA